MANLTKRIVDRAEGPKRKDGESDAAYRKRWRWIGDGEVPGFGVKIYGSGRKVFAVRYRNAAGRTRMLTLGALGECTVQEARDEARDAKADVRQGEDPQAIRQREAVRLATVRELMEAWLEEYAKAHRKRWKGDKYRIDRRILPKLGRLALEDLTADVLASWHRTIGKDAKVEANRCVETVRAAWRWADGEGLLADDLSRDPTKRVKKFREKSRDRWLRKEEISRLMEATAKEEDPHVQAIVPVLLLTGLRKRELLDSRWTDVDFDRGEIRLPETKSGGAQVRLLPAPAVDLLRNLPRVEGSPFVFPSPTDASKPRGDFKGPWARIRKAADLEDITLHDLRRTAGSHMAQSGVPLQTIQEVLGQSHPGVTRIYARLASENEREALNTLSDALSGPLGLTNGRKEPDALPNRLRALLEATEDDPEALAEGLQALALGNGNGKP